MESDMTKASIFVAALSMIVTPALAQGGPPAPKIPEYTKTPEQWSAIAPTGGAGGSYNEKVRVVTILGDPSKPGPYSQLLEVGPHATIASHHHAGDRVGTVLKGTWRLGYGPKYSADALKVLPVGSIYTEPSGVAHFAHTEDE